MDLKQKASQLIHKDRLNRKFNEMIEILECGDVETLTTKELANIIKSVQKLVNNELKDA